MVSHLNGDVHPLPYRRVRIGALVLLHVPHGEVHVVEPDIQAASVLQVAVFSLVSLLNTILIGQNHEANNRGGCIH